MAPQVEAGMAHLLARTSLVAARALFAACVICLCFWLVFAGPDFWRSDGLWSQISLPSAADCRASLVSAGCANQRDLYYNLFLLWLTPAVMALAAVVILALQPLVEHSNSTSARSIVRRWGAYLLPPRGLWMYWCGGLAVKDMLVICIWAAANASWMAAVFERNRTQLSSEGLTPPSQTTATVLAKSFGSLLAPNLVALFYPVTRGSVVLQVLGISYPAAIRYHRWLGHAVMIFVTLHSLMYWGIWTNQGQWTAKAFQQGPTHNALMAGLSFICSLALWLSALDFIRRSNYTVFKTLHHLGFWGFMVFGICHYWAVFWYFLPGLVLYGIDAVFRIHQAVFVSSDVQPEGNCSSSSISSGPKALHASVAPDGSVCSLVIQHSGPAVAESGTLWLCVPELSWFSWHPFDYITIPWSTNNSSSILPKSFVQPTVYAYASGDGAHQQFLQPGRTMLVHIKACNRWTRRLVELLSVKGPNIGVKIQGPYASAGSWSSTWQMRETNSITAMQAGPDSIVIVAGGNGIAAALLVLQKLAAANTAGLPALLIWCCRHAGHFELMAPRVLAMAQALGLNFSLKFYYTGVAPVPVTDVESKPMSMSQQAAHNSSTVIITSTAVSISSTSCSSSVNSEAAHSATASPAAAVASGGCLCVDGAVSDGLMTVAPSNVCPAAAVGGLLCNTLQNLAMHLVVFAGVLAAIILARYVTLIRPGLPWPTAQMGATYVALITAFILVPGTVTLWAALLIQRLVGIRAVRQASFLTVHKEPGTSGFSGPDMKPAAPNASKVDMVLPDQSQMTSSSETASPAAAAAAVVAAGVTAKLTSSTSSSEAFKPILVLEMPDRSCIPVESGRPSMHQLVGSWLATLKQLPSRLNHEDSAMIYDEKVLKTTDGNVPSVGYGTSSSRKDVKDAVLQWDVYATGPEQLVQQCRLVCADLNDKADAGWRIHCIQKTYQL